MKNSVGEHSISSASSPQVTTSLLFCPASLAGVHSNFKEEEIKVFPHWTWCYLFSSQASLPLYNHFPSCKIKLFLQFFSSILIITTRCSSVASQVIHSPNTAAWDLTAFQRQAAIWLFSSEITAPLHGDELILGCREHEYLHFSDSSEEMRQSNGLGQNSLNVESEQWALPAFNSLDSSGSFHLCILRRLKQQWAEGSKKSQAIISLC